MGNRRVAILWGVPMTIFFVWVELELLHFGCNREVAALLRWLLTQVLLCHTCAKSKATCLEGIRAKLGTRAWLCIKVWVIFLANSNISVGYFLASSKKKS